jgi:phosphatidylserine/phosphatidylglycerophosphate/cardiolipin synthase-like enzyme
MGHIIAAKAYANNEVALIAWALDAPIPNCLGFELTRIYLDTSEERSLASWVPFKGQQNPDWKPQTTSVWPVQKLFWRDLTVRKRRDGASRRPGEVRVKYRIRSVVSPAPGLTPVTNVPEKTYIGDPVPLAYADDGFMTNDVLITSKHGNIRATFTNGILSAQWLTRALEELGENISPDTVRRHMADPKDKFRRYLTGDVLGMLREVLDRAGQESGAEARVALYELSDKELTELIVAHKQQTHVILSNSARDSKTGEWDSGNTSSRAALRAAGGLDLVDRMFNNNHIGHNKFALLLGSDSTPRAVMTGSTNWTPTGLCGQSNNAMIIESPELARRYSDYWSRLLADTKLFKTPDPLSGATSNVQGPAMRTANAGALEEIVLEDGTAVTLWCAPNTAAKTKQDQLPPDLAAVFSMMRKAVKAILFAAFLPSQSGKASIIEEAITLGLKDPSLIVYGTVSDPKAMPNYVPPKKTPGADGGQDPSGEKTPQPAVYDHGNVHIVRAAALTKDDLVGQFEHELLKAGNAIIHDKIVVVDPLSAEGFVVMGSHNLGYKASYENDENLLIIRNNRTLAEAYAVHVMDLYEHYRFRAVQQELRRLGKKTQWDGFLSLDSKWLDPWMKPPKSALADYFSR